MRNPLPLCGFRLQFAESTYNLRIPLSICGFHLQLRIPGKLKFTNHIYYCLFVDSTKGTGFRKFVAESAKLRVFGTLSFNTVFELFVCGIQNSKEDQRKVTMLWIPQQIWFWPVPESAYDAQKSQFGLVMINFKMKQLI